MSGATVPFYPTLDPSHHIEDKDDDTGAKIISTNPINMKGLLCFKLFQPAKKKGMADTIPEKLADTRVGQPGPSPSKKQARMPLVIEGKPASDAGDDEGTGSGMCATPANLQPEPGHAVAIPRDARAQAVTGRRK